MEGTTTDDQRFAGPTLSQPSLSHAKRIVEFAKSAVMLIISLKATHRILIFPLFGSPSSEHPFSSFIEIIDSVRGSGEIATFPRKVLHDAWKRLSLKKKTPLPVSNLETY